MATPKIQIAPELVAEGKRLYETTMTTIADIAALMGISRRTLENRIVEWKNGAVAQVFSAEDPESLRGPQFSAAWADELAKWRQTAPTRSPQTWRNGR